MQPSIRHTSQPCARGDLGRLEIQHEVLPFKGRPIFRAPDFGRLVPVLTYAPQHESLFYSITSLAELGASNGRSGRMRKARPAPSNKRQIEPANGNVQLPVRSIR